MKGFYASINHEILMEIVGRYVQDEAVLALLWGYLRRYLSDLTFHGIFFVETGGGGEGSVGGVGR